MRRLIWLGLFLSCGREQVKVDYGKLENPHTDDVLYADEVSLGRRLFYDPILSKDSSISCASCHQQAYAFSDQGKSFSNGVFGHTSKRNAISLSNLQFATQFNWDGGAKDLASQALIPIADTNEMGLSLAEAVSRLNQSAYKKKFQKIYKIDSVSTKYMVMAIAAFEKMIITSHSRYDYGKLNVQEKRGLNLFQDPQKGNCASCHSMQQGLFTDYTYKNNGIVNGDLMRYRITGKDSFHVKVPSLRNIGLTAPYMHDGSLASLEQVLEHYNRRAPLNAHSDASLKMMKVGRLSNQDCADIIAFLHTLSDSVLITNPDYANPFVHHDSSQEKE
jgi:cytochrome c peroxidase